MGFRIQSEHLLLAALVIAAQADRRFAFAALDPSALGPPHFRVQCL